MDKQKSVTIPWYFCSLNW